MSLLLQIHLKEKCCAIKIRTKKFWIKIGLILDKISGFGGIVSDFVVGVFSGTE